MKSKLLKSSSILVLMRLIYRCLGLISMLILARLLIPEDFGIMAIAGLFIFFFDILSSTGIQQYLVQKEKIDNEDIDSAWTLDIIIKSSMALLCLVLSPLISIYYDNPQIGYAVAVLSIAIILRALMNPGLHELRRHLEYSLIFKVNVLQKVLSVIVVISIAMVYQSFWAMIAGDIVSALTGIFFSYKYCTYRPTLNKKKIKEQWDFSKWMLFKGVIGYARAQIDIFLVSRFFPIAEVGQYNLSKEITVMPAFDIVRPAVEPLIATLSRVRNDLDEFGKQLSYAILVVMLLISPICIFLLNYSELIITVILGDKWIGVIPITKALTLMLFAFSLGNILNNAFLALGKVRAIFLYDVFSLIFVAALLLSISFSDIIHFSLWRSLAALIVTGVFLVITIKTIKCKISLLVSSITGPLLAVCFAFYATSQINIENTFIDLVMIGSAFLATYIVGILLVSYIFHKINAVANTCFQLEKTYLKRLTGGKK